MGLDDDIAILAAAPLFGFLDRDALRLLTSALIGQLALFVRGTRPTEARAEGSAAVMRITPMLMRRVLEEFPAAAQAVHDTLADDLAGLVTDLDQVRGLLEVIDGISSGDSSDGRL